MATKMLKTINRRNSKPTNLKIIPITLRFFLKGAKEVSNEVIIDSACPMIALTLDSDFRPIRPPMTRKLIDINRNMSNKGNIKSVSKPPPVLLICISPDLI